MYTKQQWITEGNFVYALEHEGWKRGEEQFRNRFYAGVQGYRDIPKEELEANARLMAAAPELLEALKAMMEAYATVIPCTQNADWCDDYNRAAAVIAKALGNDI